MGTIKRLNLPCGFKQCEICGMIYHNTSPKLAKFAAYGPGKRGTYKYMCLDCVGEMAEAGEVVNIVKRTK